MVGSCPYNRAVVVWGRQVRCGCRDVMLVVVLAAVASQWCSTGGPWVPVTVVYRWYHTSDGPLVNRWSSGSEPVLIPVKKSYYNTSRYYTIVTVLIVFTSLYHPSLLHVSPLHC